MNAAAATASLVNFKALDFGARCRVWCLKHCALRADSAAWTAPARKRLLLRRHPNLPRVTPSRRRKGPAQPAGNQSWQGLIGGYNWLNTRARRRGIAPGTDLRGPWIAWTGWRTASTSQRRREVRVCGLRGAACRALSTNAPCCFFLCAAGEIHELKEELASLDRLKKKEAVKKVIAAMTVGKDVSMLFPAVVNNMQTEDLELKKLVYLYLINYAKTQPDLAIMAVNTFVKASARERCRVALRSAAAAA